LALSLLVLLAPSLGLAGCGDDGDSCLDLDGDGYGAGLGCLGSDCDDSDPTCHTGACCPLPCQDFDGDGYGLGSG
jgi:hypothetical protein